MKIRKIIFAITIPVLFVFAGCKTPAQSKFEWPCFHGPDRTNKSKETGLAQNGPMRVLNLF